MAKILKSIEAEKKQKKEKEDRKKKKHKRKHHHRKDSDEEGSSFEYRRDQEDTANDENRRKRGRLSSKHHLKAKDISDDEGRKKRVRLSAEHHGEKKSRNMSIVLSASEGESEDDRSGQRRSEHHQRSKIKHEHSLGIDSDSKDECINKWERKKTDHATYDNRYKHKDVDYGSRNTNRNSEGNSSRFPTNLRNVRIVSEGSNRKDLSVSGSAHLLASPSQLVDNSFGKIQKQNSIENYGYNRRRGAPKLSEEERAARLREMQVNAEDHEQHRWKLLKKAADADRQEVLGTSSFYGKNFLHDAQKSIYGTEKGGSSTIEDSVRRRAFFSEGSTAASERNAFRR